MRQLKAQKGNKQMKEILEENKVEEPDVENFVVNYSDGTQRTIEKGFFCEMKPDGEGSVLTFTMANCSDQDLAAIVYGCIELGEKLGFFGKNTNKCRS